MTRMRIGVTLAAVLLAASACGGSSNVHSATSPSYAPVHSAAPTSTLTSLPLPKGVLAQIALYGGPLRLGAGFGSIWVASHRGPALYRISPKTDKIVASVDMGGEACGSPEAAYGHIWVTGCGPGPTIEVDPNTNQVVGSIKGGPLVLGFADGKVWTPDPYDAHTLHRVGKLGVSGGDVVVGGGSLWVADSDQGTVSRIDPGTQRAVHTYSAGVAGSIEDFAVFADGALWVYAGGNKVWRIDAATNQVAMHTLHHAGEVDLASFTVGGGSIWVRGVKVNRYDEHSFKLEGHYAAEPGASGFELIAFGSLWVTNLERDNIYRDRL